VPPAPIRQLRDLTRARTVITRERGRKVQRLEKLLEDAGITLSSVASDKTYSEEEMAELIQAKLSATSRESLTPAITRRAGSEPERLGGTVALSDHS
jgi:hypothetical protein